MSKTSVQRSDGVPVKPRHRQAWGAILGTSPYRTPPSGSRDPDSGDRALVTGSTGQLGVKGLVFVARSDDDLRDFPQVARQRVGYQLHLLQSGQDPSDWEPTAAVGPGCSQIRVQHSGETYRVSYVASFADTVYVLHASQKQGPESASSDFALGQRYEQMTALIRARETAVGETP